MTIFEPKGNPCYARKGSKSPNTLDHLLREGLSRKILQKSHYCRKKISPTRNEFLDALPKPMTLIEQGILLRYASTEQIKIQADEFTTDLKKRCRVSGQCERNFFQGKT
ncbi:MAG: hypothetical protein Ct9H300mP28_28440 [Pseudomonadota bacterium]|nr:MAG: hypothetical protein Ct9H300mP28_28440 [Pseudomonadota bacterium]